MALSSQPSGPSYQQTNDLQATQNLLRTALDSSLDMIQVFETVRNQQGDIVDFTCILHNQAAEKRYGNLIGKSLLKQHPAVLRTGLFDHLVRVAQTGVAHNQELYDEQEPLAGWFYQALVKTDQGVAMTTRDISQQKQTEQELRRLKEEVAQPVTDTYQALFNSIDQGFNLIELIFDDQGHVIDYWQREHNPLFTRMTGLTDAIGKRMSELVPYVEPEWHQMIESIYYTGEPIRIEYPVQALGQWFTAYMSRVGDAGSPFIACLYDDITERKQHQQRQAYLLNLNDALRPLTDPVAIQATAARLLGEQLQTDRAYYVTIDDASGDCIVARDWHRPGSPSHTRRYLLGEWPMPGLLTGKTWVVRDTATDPAIPDEQRETYRAHDIGAALVVPLLKAGKLVAKFVANQRAPRSWTSLDVLLVEETAQRTWAAVEQANAEAALRHSEAHLATLFQAAQVGISELDLEGRFLRVNDQLCQLLGRSPSTLLGMSLLEVTHPADVATSLATLGQVRQTGQPIAIDKRYQRADGGLVCANSSLALLPGTDGNGATILAITVDLTQRQLAEEALRQGEERYRTLVENLPDYAIFRVDTDGLISEWTEGAQQVMGYAAEEMIGQPVSSLYTPQAQQAGEPAEELSEALRTGRAERENLRVRKTGERFWVNEITTAIVLASGQVVGFTKISRDISRRKRGQEARRQLEQRTRLAIEAADMATWEWHLAQDEVFWNEQHFRMLGMEPQPGPIPSAAFIDRIHPDDRPWVTPELRRVIAQQTLFDVEFRVVRDDGVVRWMSGYGRVTKLDAGVPLQLSGVMLDITQRKVAEQALRQSEEQLRAILESAKDYAIFTTDLDQRVTSWNPGAQALFGYSAEDILQQLVNRLYTPQDRQQDIPRHEARVAIQTGRFDNERWHSRQDGSLFYGSGVVTPLRDETGTIIGLLKVMRDLTAQKRTEEALKEADRRKDEFLAMLAHELRNPMSTIRSGLQILTLTAPDEMTQSTVVMMNRQTDHLVRMLDDLLDVSRISRGKIELKAEPVNLVDLVGQAVGSLQPQFNQQGKTLSIDLPTVPIQLLGDATRLTQVVTNLLTNGLRYTGDGGLVWLQVAQQSSPEGRELALIQVRDNGIGLASDQQSAIFELFVQVDNSTARVKGGLGLGLTLVKRLVELHGGWVEAQSPGLGQGSTFTVHLPMPVTVADPTPAPTLPATDLSDTRRLLVIDDNADAASTLAMLLKLKGYETHIRNSGRSGIEAAGGLQPAAILLDIGMPELDGYATCRLIRQQAWGRALVVIALTGYGQEEDRQRTREAGFDGHLVKPVDLDALTKLLTDLLDKG